MHLKYVSLADVVRHRVRVIKKRMYIVMLVQVVIVRVVQMDIRQVLQRRVVIVVVVRLLERVINVVRILISTHVPEPDTVPVVGQRVVANIRVVTVQVAIIGPAVLV